jgi:hypothetical protein
MFAIAHKAAKDLISNLKININENLTLPSQCQPINPPVKQNTHVLRPAEGILALPAL